MIQIPTVLILGAGASAHCAYPLGSQFVSQLSSLRGTSELNNLPDGWTRSNAEAFLTKLSRSGHYSIDAFLEKNREQAELGKFLIARELKKHEDINLLFPPHNSGWYQYLFNQLLAPDGSPDFAANQLGIVTFNYDRSLEAYLHTALQARFDINEDEAAKKLKSIAITHVHGILGKYPEARYQRETELSELMNISSQIQIIHEISDQDVGFCNAMFKQAHEMLVKAKRIYFLGFGFHPDNIRRFRFFTPENTTGKLILSTLRGLGTRERNDLIARLIPAGFKSSDFDSGGYECNSFFKYSASLD
jgi:hypothetical protein